MAALPLPSGSDPLGPKAVSEQQSMQDPIAGGNKWSAYFGPSSHEIQTRAMDKYAYETYARQLFAGLCIVVQLATIYLSPTKYPGVVQ